MNIALTGGTGFLGRLLIERLVQSGHQVTAWCRCAPDSAPQTHGVRWIQGQLGNEAAAALLVQNADAVIHSAVFRGGDSFLQPTADPIEYWNTNATGSLQLLEASHQSAVKRFLFVSSGAVHDQVVEGRTLDETHPLLPGTLYGAYKASVETLVHHYGVSEKLWTATVRPTSIYAAATPVENSKWFSLIKEVRNGNDVHVTGGSKTVHASDVAKAALLLLEQNELRSGETFNCCDRMISEYEVAEIAKRLCKSTSKITGLKKEAKHQINTDKLQAVGMQFGGTELLEATIAELLDGSSPTK